MKLILAAIATLALATVTQACPVQSFAVQAYAAPVFAVPAYAPVQFAAPVFAAPVYQQQAVFAAPAYGVGFQASYGVGVVRQRALIGHAAVVRAPRVAVVRAPVRVRHRAAFVGIGFGRLR